MFEDFDLMNVWNILEIRKDLDKGYGYVGHDIRNMMATASWIFLRQEGKKLFNKHMKYNLFYSKAIGAVIYGLGKKHKWMHSVFHLACIIGSVLQALCILLYVM